MGLTLEQILNTKDGMTAIRDNEKNVTRPDIVAGSEWLEFYGTAVKTLSIDGNTGISFNDTGIKDMRICGLYGTAVFGVYRQEAELWNGTRFLKIRVEMYNDWFSTDEKYRVIYELFFYDNGIIFVNIPKTPDSASLVGESHIRKPDGTLVALTVANQAKPENPAYITIKNPFSESQEIQYEKYDPYQATGILISELPLKTEYYRYAETDFEGLEVKWTDETGYMRACRNYTLSECSTEEPGTQIITVTAGEFTAEFEITVLETAVTGIRVTPPARTEYMSGEEIDLTGIKVEYILSNGQFEETKKYQVSDFDNEFIGTQSLIVTCGRFSDSFDVTIMVYILEPFLNTTEGMSVLRNNVKNDDGTDPVEGVNWFLFGGRTVSTIYVSGNNWIGLGISEEQLKICRRDGAVYYVYRQEGTLENGTEFLKIRVEGYTSYSYKDDTYKLVYELFLFEDAALYVNIIHTPSNVSYMGISSVTNGYETITLNITPGITEDSQLGILVESNEDSLEVLYERYIPSVFTGIEIISPPQKTQYYINELLDDTGLAVNAMYSNGKKCRIKGYILSGYDNAIAGEKVITVTKKGMTAVFTVTVLEISIIGIRVTPPIKTEYEIREEIDLTGIRVEYILSNGQFEETQKYQVSDFDNEFIGTQSLTVTYGRFSGSFDVTIKNTMEFRMGSPNLEDVIAEFDLETGMLTISGIGATTRPPQFGVIHGLIKTVVVEHGVTEIGEYMFSNDEAITSVSLPDTLTQIGDRAFYWCRGLTDIQIPNSVSEICYRAFGDCTGLLTVSIPSGYQ